MFFSTVQMIFASVASVASLAFVRQVLPIVTGAIRGRRAEGLLCDYGLHSDVINTHASSAYTSKTAEPKPKVPTPRGTESGATVHSDKRARASTPRRKDIQPKRPVASRVKFLDAPIPSKTAGEREILQQPKGSTNSPASSVKFPRSSVQVSKSKSIRGTALEVLGSNHGSNRPAIPFPVDASPPLRASQSAPSRMSRMTQPSQARRIIPTKRLVKFQEDDTRPTDTKRRRLFRPYASPILATVTSPQGRAALSISSLLSPHSPSTSVASSDSVMSLSELTYGRQAKRARPTTSPAMRYEVSSSGKPGALHHVPSLVAVRVELRDVEMSNAPELETPEVTISSSHPEMGNGDAWMVSPTTISILDEDMRSPFDEDVVMEEAWRDEHLMEIVYADEDIRMRDWTDEDVEMTEIT